MTDQVLDLSTIRKIPPTNYAVDVEIDGLSRSLEYYRLRREQSRHKRSAPGSTPGVKRPTDDDGIPFCGRTSTLQNTAVQDL